MSHPVHADCARGSLITMALAESLGFLVEGGSPRYCNEVATGALAAAEPPWLERGEYAFGQYATDTQLARELARSVIACRGFTPVDYAERIDALFGSNTALAPENATWRASGRLSQGMTWAQVGEPAPAAGNGAIARAAPIGLTFRTREFRGGAARMQAEISHHDPRSQAAAQLFAEAVFLAATTDDLEPRAFLAALADVAEPLDPRLASSTRTLERFIALPLSDALPHVARAGFNPADGYPPSEVISGFSTPTVLWALQSFLRNPRSPELVIVAALSGGGDTGSVAAAAGALVGAHVGYSGLGPRLQRWAERLNDHGEDGSEVLSALASDLVARA
jgi:ADP-ribosylglycohydrolase